MAGLIDMVNRMAGSTGPFMKAWGEDVTGTVFATGSGKIADPIVSEGQDDDTTNRRETRGELVAEFTLADLVENFFDKTVVYGGQTYVVREKVRADSGMVTLRASRRLTTSTGRHAGGGE